MKTEWDYTDLADAYLKRPDYSEEAISKLLDSAGIKNKGNVCDVGAGCAHLTLPLLQRGLTVNAIEPNDSMRRNGIERTKDFKDKVKWFEATGENTQQPDKTFDLVTFGSSFSVTDRQVALKETARILKSKGWFACMWNHRDLEDKIQKKIEDIIHSYIPTYDYGTRREDQTEVINESKLFESVRYIEGQVYHEQSIEDCVEAWHSHATLARQASDNRNALLRDIKNYLESLNTPTIQIPYTTRIWAARLRA